MHAEILFFDGFDELDAMGPWEVLAGVAAVRDDVTARLVTLEGAREVRADHGAVVHAHGALSERPDVLLVPGGGWFDRTRRTARGRRPAAGTSRGRSPSAMPRAPSSRRSAPGALLLAHAGVLRGHRATTNRGALDDLRGFEGVEVVDARVVDDGDVVTAGGPVCGIDLALALVGRFGGAAMAEAAATEIHYERPAALV